MPNQKQSSKSMSNLDSSELPRLKEFLAQRGIDFVSEITANRTPPIDFALSIPGDRIADLAGKGQISHRQMKLIQSTVKKELGSHPSHNGLSFG
jgi:hypothetical protein